MTKTRAEKWVHADEAADFDAADFDVSQVRPSNVRAASEPKSSLAVRFDALDIDRLRGVAADAGIGVTQLVRQWVLERLSVEQSGSPDALAQSADETLAAASVLMARIEVHVANVRLRLAAVRDDVSPATPTHQ